MTEVLKVVGFSGLGAVVGAYIGLGVAFVSCDKEPCNIMPLFIMGGGAIIGAIGGAAFGAML